MGTYNVPRNTKGENRILFIFSNKSFLYTIIGIVVGLPLYFILRNFNQIVAIIITLMPGLVGFVLGTIKVRPLGNVKWTKDTEGENLDEVIRRAIEFRRKGKKLYFYNREDEE